MMADLQGSVLRFALLFAASSIPVANGQPPVFLSLSGVVIPNDSYVLASDIGEGASGLPCITDRSDCCRSSDGAGHVQGERYFPEAGGVVPIEGERTGDFFYRNRDTGIVRLNRRGAPPERGRFHCEIPNADGINVTLYVNIVDEIPTTQPGSVPTTDQSSQTLTTQHPVSITVAPITHSGSNTAGESYSLECTVTVSGSTDQPTINWLDPMDNIITSGVMMTGGMSTLTFNPLAASHAGTYTCRTTLGSAMDSASRTITVQNPTINASIASTIATPMVGSMYSLICTVTGAERLTDAMVTYQWFKNGVVVSGQTMVTLSFSPLTFSDVGNYTCEVTVTSSLLSAPITTPALNSLGVQLTLMIADTTTEAVMSTAPDTTNPSSTIQATTTQAAQITTTTQASSTLPDPTTPTIQATQVQVSFQSDKDSNDIFFSLTCNSTGGQANSVVWTRDGFLLHNTGPLVLTDASTLSYTNVLTVSSRTPGTYTCTIRGSSDQVLNSANFTVQASAPPVDVVATQSSSSAPVEVSWSPPTDKANITGYSIYYSNGRSLLVHSYYVSSIIILNNPPDVGEIVSIHSESTQLPSELVNITVMIEGDRASPASVLCTCSSEVGTYVGVLLIIEGFIALVTVITVVLLWRRRKRSANVDITVIANMAYGEVRLGTNRAHAAAGGGDLAECEDPERMDRPEQEQERYELSGQWQYESIPAIRAHIQSAHEVSTNLERT